MVICSRVIKRSLVMTGPQRSAVVLCFIPKKREVFSSGIQKPLVLAHPKWVGGGGRLRLSQLHPKHGWFEAQSRKLLHEEEFGKDIRREQVVLYVGAAPKCVH